jgi:hypothetical protein
MKPPSPDAVTIVQPTDAGNTFWVIETCLHWRQRVFMNGAAAAMAMPMAIATCGFSQEARRPGGGGG